MELLSRDVGTERPHVVISRVCAIANSSHIGEKREQPKGAGVGCHSPAIRLDF